jgi:hypothetical protein
MNRLLAKVLALLAVVAGIFLAGRKSGKDDIRAETNEKALEDVRKANAIDDSVSRLSDDDLNSQLRSYTKH